MTIRSWVCNPRNRLDVVGGLVDGILNALTLAAGRMLRGAGVDIELAVRVGTAAGVTTIFVFFMAHYAELRAELSHAERQLNVLSHGKLKTSRLGVKAIQQAFSGAVLAAACGVAGAVLSLCLCVLLPQPYWVGPLCDIGLLGILGASLARSVHGAPWLWAPAVMAGGLIVTWVGILIDITG